MKKIRNKSVAETVDKEKLTRARNLIVSIYISQFKRRCFILLMRAFTKWSREYSLYLKCDELSKQLKERTLGLEEVRKAYLRDVVNVKIYLEKIANFDVVEVDKYNYLHAITSNGLNKISEPSNDDEFELSPYQQGLRQVQEQQIKQLKVQHANMKNEIVGINSTPSADLRGLIRKAVDSVNNTSIQFRDNLITAGVLDIEKMRTLNPWEQGTSYTRHMKIKKGHFFSLPETGGESIALSAPARHKLYVKYCNDCIGIISLVRSWNLEVEEALRFRIEHGALDQQIVELKKLIANLNVIIENQEIALNKEVAKNKVLEEANSWFTSWMDAGKVEALQSELTSLKRQLVENLSMAQADIESSTQNVVSSLKTRLSAAVTTEEALYKVIRKERLAKEVEVKARHQMFEDLSQCQKDLTASEKQNTILVELRDNEIEKNAQLQQQINAQKETIAGLERECLLKDNIYKEMRAESVFKIDFLKKQIGDLSSRCFELEKDVASSEENVRLLKIENMHVSASLQHFVAKNEAEIRAKEISLRRKKKLTVKIIAIVVRTMIRIIRSFHRRDFPALGLLGYRMMVRQLERREARSKHMVEVLREKNAELESNRFPVVEQPRFTRGSNLNEKEMGSVLKKFMRSSFTMNLGVEMEDISEDQFQNIVNSRHYERFTDDIIKKFSSNLLRTKILIQMQRNHANQIAGAVFSSRAIISNLELDQEIATLTETSVQQAKINDKESKLKPIGRMKDLRKKFTIKSNNLMRWIKANKKKSGRLLPFKLPFDILEEIKRIPKGRMSVGRNQFSFKIESLYASDREQTEAISDALHSDMRKVEQYITLLKQRIEKLKEENREALAQKLKWETDDLYSNSGAASGADYDFLKKQKREQTSQEKLIGLKSNLIHLLDDPNGVSKYLASLVKAIENVQADEETIKSDASKSKTEKKSTDKKNKKQKKDSKNASANEIQGSALSKSNSSPVAAPQNSMVRKRTLILDKIVPKQLVDNKKSKNGNQTNKLDTRDASLVRSEGKTSSQPVSLSSRPIVPLEIKDAPAIQSGAADGGSGSYGSGRAQLQNITESTRQTGSALSDNNNLMPAIETAVLSSRRLSNAHILLRENMSYVQNILDDSKAEMRSPKNHRNSARAKNGGGSPKNNGRINGGRRRMKAIVDRGVGTADDNYDIVTHSSLIQGGSIESIEPFLDRSTADVYLHDANNIDHTEFDSSLSFVHNLNGGIGLQSGRDFDNDAEDAGSDEDDDYNEGEEEVGDREQRDYSPLEIAKLEATAILRHEQRLSRQIKAQQRQNENLLVDLQVVTSKLEDQKKKYHQATIEQEQIVDDVSKIAKEYEAVKRQNSLLREIVEESYKNQAAAIDKVLENKELELQQQEKRRRAKYKNVDTQIACVVCAKREHFAAPGPNVHETAPIVHESMARALAGEFILVAKPRHINGVLSRFVRNDADDAREYGDPADPVMHPLMKMKSSGQFNTISDFNSSNNVRPPLNRSPSDKELQTTGRPPLFRTSTDISRLGDLPQQFSRPSSAQVEGRPPLQIGNDGPLSADSKFSRINQIPTKIFTPKASANKNKNSRDRTLPNTAAYLQGKILADSQYHSDHILSEHEPTSARSPKHWPQLDDRPSRAGSPKRVSHLDDRPSRAGSPKRVSHLDDRPSTARSARSPKRVSQLDRV